MTEIKTLRKDEDLVVEFTGTINFRDHEAFMQLIEEIKKEDGKKVVIDLANVEFVDSAALGMFVILSGVAKNHNVAITVRNHQDKVRSVMIAAQFEKLFHLE